MTKLNSSSAMADYVKRVANHRGWVVNSDETFVSPIVSGLVTQVERHGKPYCPCRDAVGGETDRDIVCPCIYAQADIQEYGQCYCALFLSPGQDAKTVTSIPERRP